MKIAMLSANLGSFDETKDPVPQETEHQVIFHRWTDDNFPPITGLTPRFQYRIPKIMGWQMLPGYDVYIWFDANCSLQRPDCVDWYVKQLGDADAAFFKHHLRDNVKEEVEHIEQKLKQNHAYIVPRYKNGLHREMYEEVILKDTDYVDDKLYTSTAFIYRNTPLMQEAMKLWFYYQSRYWTCDQIAQVYAMYKAGVKVNMINEYQFAIGYLSLIYKHH